MQNRKPNNLNNEINKELCHSEATWNTLSSIMSEI